MKFRETPENRGEVLCALQASLSNSCCPGELEAESKCLVEEKDAQRAEGEAERAELLARSRTLEEERERLEQAQVRGPKFVECLRYFLWCLRVLQVVLKLWCPP